MSQKVPFRWHGCPTYKTAEKTLREVLAEEGMDAQVKLVAVNTDEEARRLRFPGSPRFGLTAKTCSRRRARGLAAGLPDPRDARGP